MGSIWVCLGRVLGGSWGASWALLLLVVACFGLLWLLWLLALSVPLLLRFHGGLGTLFHMFSHVFRFFYASEGILRFGIEFLCVFSRNNTHKTPISVRLKFVSIVRHPTPYKLRRTRDRSGRRLCSLNHGNACVLPRQKSVDLSLIIIHIRSLRRPGIPCRFPAGDGLTIRKYCIVHIL